MAQRLSSAEMVTRFIDERMSRETPTQLALRAETRKLSGAGMMSRPEADALKKMGKDPERFAAMDLSTGDELHLGWLPATAALAKDLGLAPGMHVLDVGSGIGGPARYFAEAHKCRVTGIDLTEEFVQTATDLTRRCGLRDLVGF